MPYIKISPPTGPLNVFYSISTPLCHDAVSIIPHLPTILFLHPVYMPQQIFQAQFSDPYLRQFNLVAFDMRSHGRTEGVIGEAKYMPAEDAYYFMEAIRLPPCHVFGLSIGCCVALELASLHPDYVLSLTLCSPLSPVESAEVASGRMEVHQAWSNATLLPEGVAEQVADRADKSAIIDLELENDAIVGVKQLAFNNDMDELTSAITKSAIAQAHNHWLGSPERSQEAYRSVIQWPLERRGLTESEFRRIKSPTSVIYCTEDFVYSFENAQSLETQLKAAGVMVQLFKVSGPHYGCVAAVKLVNPIIRDLVLSCYDKNTFPPVSTTEWEQQSLRTPFEGLLEKFDYLPLDHPEIQFFNSGAGSDPSQHSIVA